MSSNVRMVWPLVPTYIVLPILWLLAYQDHFPLRWSFFEWKLEGAGIFVMVILLVIALMQVQCIILSDLLLLPIPRNVTG